MKKDILYSFRRCPYAIRVRWALLVCDIEVELREIDLKNKPIEFLNSSITKTVPILIKRNTEIIEESLDIVLWALSKSKKKSIYLPDLKEKETFAIINENDNEFKYHLDRFKYATRYQKSNEEFHFKKSKEFIEKCNEFIVENRFLIGENPTIADWCIWPFIRQFKIACESQKRTNFLETPMQKWLGYFENHKNFKYLMYKYELWEPNSEANYFPHS